MKKRRIAALFCGIILCGMFSGAGCSSASEDNGEQAAAHEHTYSSDWTVTETEHYHAAICGHTAESSERAAHIFENDVCKVCGYSRKSEEKPVYEGLHFSGETAFTAYENEDFTVGLPRVFDKNEKNVPLEAVFTVYDSDFKAQGKIGNTVNLPVGMYTVKFTLKDRTYSCDPLSALLEVRERNRVVLCDFSSAADVEKVTDQPKVNFGTNGGTKSYLNEFGGRNGVLAYAVGIGANSTAQGSRDGFYVPFASPVAVDSLSKIRFIAYIEGGSLTRLAFGFKCDGDFGSDYFWLRSGKNVWRNDGTDAETLIEKWSNDDAHSGTAPKKIEGIYLRLPYADAGAKLYLDCIYYTTK